MKFDLLLLWLLPSVFGQVIDCPAEDGDEGGCLALAPDCIWEPVGDVCVPVCNDIDVSKPADCTARDDCNLIEGECVADTCSGNTKETPCGLVDGCMWDGLACVEVVPVVPDCCPCEVPPEYLYNAKVTLNSTCVTSMLANQAMCEVDCQDGLEGGGSVNITCDNGVLLYNGGPDFFASELVCACPVGDIGEVSFDGCPCNKGYKGSGTCAEGSMCSDIGHKHEYICVKKYSKCTVGELGCPCLEDNTCLKDKKDKPLVCTQVLDVPSGIYEATCAVSSGKKGKGGSYGSSSTYSSYSSREKGGDYYRDSYRPRSRHTHYYP